MTLPERPILFSKYNKFALLLMPNLPVSTLFTLLSLIAVCCDCV